MHDFKEKLLNSFVQKWAEKVQFWPIWAFWA